MSKCIFIIGMHRSGTSLLASLFHKNGISCGSALLEPDWINPAGYFEDTTLLSINKYIYAAERYDRFMIPRKLFKFHNTFFSDQSGVLDTANQYALEMASKNDVWVWKNPRLCILLPFWIFILERNDIDWEFITVDRPGKQVKRSLMRTQGMTMTRALYVIRRHKYNIETLKHDYYTRWMADIRFEDIVNRTGFVAKRLSRILRLELNDWSDIVNYKLIHFGREK